MEIRILCEEMRREETNQYHRLAILKEMLQPKNIFMLNNIAPGLNVSTYTIQLCAGTSLSQKLSQNFSLQFQPSSEE